LAITASCVLSWVSLAKAESIPGNREWGFKGNQDQTKDLTKPQVILVHVVTIGVAARQAITLSSRSTKTRTLWQKALRTACVKGRRTGSAPYPQAASVFPECDDLRSIMAGRHHPPVCQTLKVIYFDGVETSGA
jgi:hypothetical protein